MKISQLGLIEMRYQAQRGSNSQYEFEFVNSTFDVALETETKHFEDDLEIEQHGEDALDVVVAVESALVDVLLVRVLERGRDHGVGEDEQEHGHVEPRRAQHALEHERREAFRFVVVHADELETLVGALEHLLMLDLSFLTACAPHLLELHTNLGECFDDNGNKHILFRF